MKRKNILVTGGAGYIGSHTAEKVNDINISYKIGQRRAGDVEEIYSNNTKINNELGWFPVMSFESALKTNWIWEKNK